MIKFGVTAALLFLGAQAAKTEFMKGKLKLDTSLDLSDKAAPKIVFKA